MVHERCFVTGGAGFIGSHLVDKLIIEGHKVTVFDNLSSGREEVIAQHKNNPNLKFVFGDLLELESLKKVISNHNIVFHLAANPDARMGIQDTTLDLRLETLATYNTLEAMRCNGIKQIILASSGTIYGETPVIPLTEDYGPVLPISLYGAGKLASEGLVSAFCNTFDMQAWIFRFGNVVGSRTTHGVIFDFIQKLKNNPHELEILGDGTQTKPYLYVGDCIEGILYGFANSRERVNVFNLGPSSATDVTTIAKVLVTELGLENVKFTYTGGDRGWAGDVPQVRFNPKKMKNMGWGTKFSSNAAVKKAIKEIVGDIKISSCR
jgi:UDP-glucose 4-epimerase